MRWRSSKQPQQRQKHRLTDALLLFCPQLVEYAPEKRMTATQALAHPLITASPVGKTLLRAKSFGSAASEAAASLTEPWLSSAASGKSVDDPANLKMPCVTENIRVSSTDSETVASLTVVDWMTGCCDS